MRLLKLEQRLRQALRGYESSVVALSGGVDSSLLAVLSASELGEKSLAVTGRSPSLPTAELQAIRSFCAARGIAHHEVDTDELSNPDYRRNHPDRCLHCKSELFARLAVVARQRGFAVLVDGTHADDLGGHRPGLKASKAAGVRSPLLDLGIGKAEVRGLARHLGLENADRPSSPCLSSRVVYGHPVTCESLGMVEQAEGFLSDLGFDCVRVRTAGTVARIEVPKLEIASLMKRADAITAGLKACGYTAVSVDPDGYRSGSLLNEWRASQ